MLWFAHALYIYMLMCVSLLCQSSVLSVRVAVCVAVCAGVVCVLGGVVVVSIVVVCMCCCVNRCCCLFVLLFVLALSVWLFVLLL